MLQQIREGMEVYDRHGDKVGTVGYVQFSDEDLSDEEPETATAQDPRLRKKGSLVDVLAEAIAPPR